MNMTDTDMANGDTQTNGIWNSLNNQSTQIHQGAITWRLETWSLEETKTKKTENSISGSTNKTQTLLCYTVYAPSNTRTKILNFFGNWTIIFIIDYFMEFCFFSVFCSKNFIILGIFTNIFLSWDNLERMWNLWRSQENSWDLVALVEIHKQPARADLLIQVGLISSGSPFTSLSPHDRSRAP